MKKNILFFVLLVFSGTAVFLNLTRPADPAPDMKYMSVITKLAKTTYTVDVSESSLQWTGRKLTGNHTGTIALKSGSIVMENDKLTGGNFVIDMTSMVNEDIENENSREKLMGHLRSDDFFGVASYPKASLNIIRVEQAENDNDYNVSAYLTIKGKTNTIVFPATVQSNDGRITAKADISFDRTKWDVRYGSGSLFSNLGDKAIYDDVDMSVSLVAGK